MATSELIFVSYATPDRDRVTIYFNDLSARGYDLWMDQSRLKVGQNWDFEIQRALNRASLILAFVSKNSIDRRGYVQREIKIALDKAMEKLTSDIYVIPVLLDDDAPLPDELRHIQAVRASEPDAIKKIEDAIRHQLDLASELISDVQGSSGIRWSTTTYHDSWEGLPGYDSQFALLQFFGTNPKISEVTDILRGSLLSSMAAERNTKLHQDAEIFNFGQKPYSRTNTWEAFPSEPSIVGQVLSFHYSVHWYGAGAAHPNMYYKTYCFLLDPLIHIRSLPDIFQDEGAAFQIVQAAVRKQLLELTPDQHPLDEDWILRGTEDWTSFRNFTFLEDGLHIYFSPYEVAAYVYGSQSAKLRFDDCKSLMRPWFKNALGLW